MRAPLLAAIAAILVIPAGSASAATFNVTKTGDDTTCTPGNCSLRGAIVAANADPDADTINVPAGTYQLTIVGDEDGGLEGDLDVRHPTTINGAGASATIVEQGDDGGEPIQDRIFDVQPQGGAPVSVTIRDLTARRGQQFEGAGVQNNANLTLERVIVRDNQGFTGGGVVHQSAAALLRIVESTIRDNSAGYGGGVTQNGEAPPAGVTAGVQIERSTISGNSAIPVSEGDPAGGGVAAFRAGTVRIDQSTITGNVAIGDHVGDDDASGGGIWVNDGVAELTNSTITGNHVVRGYGGGISNGGTGDLSLLNVTVADNGLAVDTPPERRRLAPGGGLTAAAEDPGDPAQVGGNIDSFGDSNTFKNTIVSGGFPQNCRGRFDTVFTSNGHNLEDANTCGFDQASDLTSTDPLLGPLASNGGPTQTRALEKGSPAIDTADNAACPKTDQRGIARPQPAGGTCDRGAFERPGLDLSITKLASAPSVQVGEEVRFTLAVSNAGPADATGVRVIDTLPEGLQFVSAAPSQGTCSGTTTVTCEIGTLAAGQDADVVIRATATRAGEHVNTAKVESDGTYPETGTANNTATATVTARAPRDPDPDPEPCRDRTAPVTELAQRNVRVRRGKVHLSGTTRDVEPCASGVNRVLVSLARVKGRHLINCRFVKSRTEYKLTRAPGMNCQDPVLFRAKGGVTTGTQSARYSFIYLVDLPDGIYRAQARAFDNAGNKERPTKGRNIRKFYVR